MHCVTVMWLTMALGLPVSKCDLPNRSAGYAIIQPIPAIRIDYAYYPRTWIANTKTAVAVFILAHELGHVAMMSVQETVANRYARANWCKIVTRLRTVQFNLPSCSRLWSLLPVGWV